MAKIYEYLEEKIRNGEGNKGYYFDCNIKNGISSVYKKYTFNDLYSDINNRIVEFMEDDSIVNSKICYLVVNNTFDDIVSFIALLEMGIKPFIIYEDSLYDIYDYNRKFENNEDLVISDTADVMPYFVGAKNDTIKINVIPDNYEDDGNYFLAKFFEIHRGGAKRILDKHLLVNNISDGNIYDDYDFALFTSGTTGKPSIVKVKEEELINKLFNTDDITSGQTFMGITPISAISGINYSCYLPLIGNDINFVCGYSVIGLRKYEDYLHDLTILLPGNILFRDYSKNMIIDYLYDHSSIHELKDKKIHKIVLIGMSPTDDVIEAIQSKNDFSDEDILVIYYGRTENLGIVSKIKGKDLIPVYIYYRDIRSNRIIYSLDKKNVYELIMENGQLISKKIDISYNESDFCSVLPIAVLNNEKENIKIKDTLFNEIIAEGKNTGDYGFCLNNRLYYVCRRGELLQNNESYFYVSALENELVKKMNSKKIYTRFNKTLVDQKCYAVINENGRINLYIPCRINHNSDCNFRRYYEIYKNIIDELKDNNVDKIILMDRRNVPHGRELGKLKRGKLLEFGLNKEENVLNYNGNIDFEKVVKEKLQRNDLIYCDRFFLLPRNNNDYRDIIDIASKVKLLSLHVFLEYYCLVISDEFLFGNTISNRDEISKKENDYYNELLKNYDGDEKKLFNDILLHNDVISTNEKNIVVYRDKNNSISMSLRGYVLKYTPAEELHVEYLSKPLPYWNKEIIINEEKELAVSSYYDTLYGDSEYDIIYTLNEDGQLSLNGKSVSIEMNFDPVIINIKNYLKSFQKHTQKTKKIF